ncbi:hypothetical protein BJX70DRAFT_397824 [Aspergillus crustosus]
MVEVKHDSTCQEIKLNKPCPHPVNVLFKDSRPSPPPLPLRKRILRNLLQNLTPMDTTIRTFIDAYIPKEDDIASVVKEDSDSQHKQEDCIIPQFMRLPRELRDIIWEMAVPRRPVDVMAISVSGYFGRCSPPLPVPGVGRVCREAREAVMRRSHKFAIGEYFKKVPEKGNSYPVGSLMPSDLPMFCAGKLPGRLKVPKYHYDPKGVTITAASSLPKDIEASEIGVYWSSGRLDLKLPKSARHVYQHRKEWLFLREMDNLQRIVVVSRSSYIKLRLEVDPEKGQDLRRHYPESTNGPAEFVVDLFDDQGLAEVCSLGTAPSIDATPRHYLEKFNQPFVTVQCLNCERIVWQRYTKALVERFWLCLYADELDDKERQAVFPDDIPYMIDHPWVVDKLSQAPEFRPAVVFTPIPVSRPRHELQTRSPLDIPIKARAPAMSSSTSQAETEREDHVIDPDEPCHHPANQLFKDPRVSPPPLPSPGSILGKLLRENAPNTSYYRNLIKAYCCPGDESEEPAFRNFPRFPREICDMIWRLAIPSRVLDAHRVGEPLQIDGDDGYMRDPEKVPQLFIPTIAHVCSEARATVLRTGGKWFLYEIHQFLPMYPRSPPPDPWTIVPEATPKLRKWEDERGAHEAGFLTLNDRVYYSSGMNERCDVSLQPRPGLRGFKTTSAKVLPQLLGCREIVVKWDSGHYFRSEEPCHLHDNRRCRVKAWDFIPKIDRLVTIYVLPFPRTQDSICFKADRQQRMALQENYWAPSRIWQPPTFSLETDFAQVLVDSYDDQGLAEIASLHESDDAQPRNSDERFAESKHCFNCERKLWEQSVKGWVERFWLLLYSDELDAAEAAKVFPGEGPYGRALIPYTPDHPWVKMKLSEAPEIRPAVLLNLTPDIEPIVQW